MDLEELFKIREQLLKDLEVRIKKETFNSAEEKEKYYNACVDGIIEFYAHAMISIIDSSEEKAA